MGAAVRSDDGDREAEPGLEGADLCPTLRRCLMYQVLYCTVLYCTVLCMMYQACVFNFGNELCRKDPNPGTRKNIDTNITCIEDTHFESHIHSSDLGDRYFDTLEEYKGKRDRVLNIMYDSKLDYGIEDFENTEFRFREAEEEFVFSAECPADPGLAGYRGDCGPATLSREEVGQRTWHLASRLASPACKRKVTEVFCAFQYSDTGRCVPPHLVRRGARSWHHAEVFNDNAYPRRGPRPVKDVARHQQELAKYKYKNILPARIGFALLVHKDVPAILNLLEHIYRTQHFYVFHVDKRQEGVRRELSQQLQQRFPTFNIRVLPHDRSFITSWGSFGIVRAHLEQFEELSR